MCFFHTTRKQEKLPWCLFFLKQHIQNASKSPNVCTSQEGQFTETLSYCWKTLKFRVPCSWFIIITAHHTLKKNTKACEQGNVWHHFINLQFQWKNRTFFLVPYSSQQLYLVCVYTHIHTHTVLLVSWFWSAAKDQYRIAVNQRKEQKAKQFPNGYFIRLFNIKFSSFAIQKLPEVCGFECAFTFIVHLFSKLFGTVFWGHSDCHNTSQERACLWCQFQVFKFWFGLWLFLSLKSAFYFNNCTFIFLYPLTPEFSFFPPPPIATFTAEPYYQERRLDEKIRTGTLTIRQCFP